MGGRTVSCTPSRSQLGFAPDTLLAAQEAYSTRDPVFERKLRMRDCHETCQRALVQSPRRIGVCSKFLHARISAMLLNDLERYWFNSSDISALPQNHRRTCVSHLNVQVILPNNCDFSEFWRRKALSERTKGIPSSLSYAFIAMRGLGTQ